MTGGFGLIVEFKVEPGMQARFQALICENAKQSLALEEGCLRFDVLVDGNDPTKFMLYEIYADQQAFDLHREAGHVKTFFQEAKAMIAGQTFHRLTRILGD